MREPGSRLRALMAEAPGASSIHTITQHGADRFTWTAMLATPAGEVISSLTGSSSSLLDAERASMGGVAILRAGFCPRGSDGDRTPLDDDLGTGGQ